VCQAARLSVFGSGVTSFFVVIWSAVGEGLERGSAAHVATLLGPRCIIFDEIGIIPNL
jgi:hypothetical protein